MGWHTGRAGLDVLVSRCMQEGLEVFEELLGHRRWGIGLRLGNCFCCHGAKVSMLAEYFGQVFSQRGCGIRGPMVEDESVLCVRDEVLEAVQIRNQGQASSGHGFQRGQTEGFTLFSKGRVDENGGLIVFLDELLLVEDRFGKLDVCVLSGSLERVEVLVARPTVFFSPGAYDF